MHVLLVDRVHEYIVVGAQSMKGVGPGFRVWVFKIFICLFFYSLKGRFIAYQQHKVASYNLKLFNILQSSWVTSLVAVRVRRCMHCALARRGWLRA